MFLSDIFENNAAQLLHDHRRASILVSMVGIGLFYYAVCGSEEKDQPSPLVPYTLPIVGSSSVYARNPEVFLKECVDKYGSVFRLHLGGRIKTIVSGLPVLEVLREPDFNFHNGVKKVFDIHLLLGIKESDMSSQDFRKLIAKLTARLCPIAPCVAGNIHLAHDEVLKSVPPKGANLSSDDVRKLILRMLSKSSASTFLGPDTVKAHPEIESAFTGFIPVVTDIISSSLISGVIPALNTLRVWYANKTNKDLKKYRRGLADALRPILLKRLFELEKKDDLLQWIIDIKYKHTRDLEHVVDGMSTCIVLLIFASMHTTSSSTTVVFYNLVKRPWLVEDLLKEQQEVLKKHGISPDEENPVRRFTTPVLRDLVKLDSTIRESLRTRKFYLQHPHVYEGKTDYVLSNGAVIKPGEDILIGNWLNHHDQSLQQNEHTNLDEFLPFRYAESNIRASNAGADYLVFGAGKHVCPGRFFAVQQMKIVLSFLIYRYKLTPASPVVIPLEARHSLPYGDVLLERRNNES